MEPFVKLALFALLFTASAAVPISQYNAIGDQCARTCRADPRFLHYASGKSYFYALQTTTILDAQQPISLEGAVVLSALSHCDVAIQLQRVRIQGVDADAAAQMQMALERWPLTFGYSDGVVSDVCVHSEEPQWTLNVKKAVVSALQMSAASLTAHSTVHETDLQGACVTQYEPMSERFGKHVIRKTKNFGDCDDRQQWWTGFFPKAYARFNQIPVTSGQQQCVQSIESDIVFGVTCEEQQTAFGNRFALKSQLNLRFERQLDQLVIDNKHQMQRHFLKMARDEYHDDIALEPTVQLLCQQMAHKSAKSAEQFSRLVRAVKKSSPQEIQRIYANIGHICPQEHVHDLFLDACAHAGSQGAIKVIQQFAQTQKNSLRARLLFHNLAFVSQPEVQSLPALADVLEQHGDQSHVTLGVSAFFHNTKHASRAARDSQQYKESENRVIQYLLRRISDQSVNEFETTVAIKAMQNIGLERQQRARQALAQLARSQKSPEGARVAALKALSEAMIGAEERPLVMAIVENESERNEIRVNAIKALIMSGSDASEVQKIKRVAEKSNENIGQYAQSLVKNLQETSDPHKRDIWRKTGSEWAPKPMSKWFGISNNFETSFMVDALGVGAVLESDVIYEQQSAGVPSSVVINATLPLMGREVNLIEVEVRQKGFEAILQKKLRRIYAQIEAKDARQVVDALLEFANQWENEIQSESAFVEMALKVDAKTVFFFNSRQKKNQHFFAQLLQQLSPEGAFAFQPVNTRVNIPSGNGWPLVARLNSTLLYSNTKKSDSHVISPLFVFQTEAGLQLMAKEQRREVGVAFNVQSAPAWASHVDYAQNRFQWKLSLPQERTSLLKGAAEVRTGTGSEGLLGQASYERCSEWTKKAFGFEVCFAKSAKETEVFVKKTDSIEVYEIVAEKGNALRVMFNTPNSRVDRHWETSVETSAQSAKVALKSPFIRLTGSGQWRADEKEQSFVAEVQRDGKQEMRAEVALEHVARGQKREFRPRLQLSWKQREVIQVGGSVSVAKGRKNQLMINLEGNQKQFLKGSLVREGDRKSADIRVSTDLSLHLSNGLEAKVNALFDKSAKHLTSDLQLEYRAAKSSRKEALKTSVKLQSLGQSASAQKLSAFGEVTSTQWPQLNCHLAYNLLNKMGEHVENELTAQWAENMSRKVHILQVTKVTGGERVETTVNVEVTPLNIDYELRASGEQQQQQMAAQVSGKDRSGRSQRYDFKSNVQFTHVSRAPLHLTLAADLKTAAREWKYADDLREVSKGEFKGQTSLQWGASGQPLKMAKMDYDYKKKSGVDHEMALHIQSPLAATPIKHTALLRMSRHSAHVRSQLLIGDRLHHHVESLLSSEGPNKVHVEYSGYQVKGHAHPFELPQRAGLELMTPSRLIHKTDVEIVPQKSFRLKSDTKRKNANIFALESDIQRSLPSKVIFNGKQIEGKLDFRSLNGQHSAQLNVNHLIDDWTHSSAVKAVPQTKTFEVQSKTISKGLPLLVLDSAYDRKQQKVNFLLPQKKTSLLWDSTSGPKRGAKLELNCGQNFRHISQYANDAPEVHRFDSSQTDFRSGSPLYSLQYAKNADGHQLSGHYGDYLFVDGDLKPWNQFGDRQGSASLALKNKRSQFEHNSKIAFDNRILKLESQTRKQNQNLAEIEAQLAAQESQLSLKLPRAQTRAHLIVTPSSGAKLQYSAPNADHVTSLEWTPARYACDSKTTLDNHVTYALAANHAPDRKSFVSIKTPNYDVSGHVDRTWATPSAKVTVITPRQSHVTEVSADRSRKSIRIESRADRKSGPEATENVYNLDANYNHYSSASTLGLKIAKNLKISAKVQPFAQTKFLHVAAEHPTFAHTTDVTVDKHVTLKSRTSDQNGRNLAKIDSSLPLVDFKGEKSHVTLVSPHLDASVEIEPRRSVRFQYRDPKWTHSSAVSAQDLKWNVVSNTKRNGQSVLDLNGHYSYAQPISAQIALKTPSIGHESHFAYDNGLAFDSNTEYENQLLNKIRFDSRKHFDLSVPQFAAQTQWSPEGAHVDYRSRMPSGRHVLASVRLPRDGKQFGVDVAWDQQRDPNQRLKLEWEARDAVHVLRAEYAGNAVIVESSVRNAFYGPNAWSAKYVPKFNTESDSLEVRVSHVISDATMTCHVTYLEGQRPKVDMKLVTTWKQQGEVGVDFESTSAQNPDLNVKLALKTRAEGLKTANAQIMTQVRFTRSDAKQYALEWHVARAQQSEADVLKGDMSVETPSGGRQEMDFRLDVKRTEVHFAATSQDRKLLEVNARADNERAQEKHVSLELKSNIGDIPSVSISGDYFRYKELSLRAEVDGERKAEVSLIRTGSDIQSGSQVTFRAETSYWPKFESLLSLKKNSEEIDFEINAKIDSKEVFSAILKAKKSTSGAWSGTARVSDNGSQLAQLEAEATSGQSATNFRYALKGNSRRNALFGAMRVLFSVERNRKSGARVKVNACEEEASTCVDVNALWKHVDGVPERAELSVQKNGQSFELRTSFGEHVDDSSSGPSLLGLTSGRVSQKTRHEAFVAVNGHQMGFEMTRVQRGRHAREHVVRVEFPNKKEVTFKADFRHESGHWTQKTQLVDNGKQEVIVETEVEAVDSQTEFRLRAEAKSAKFGRNQLKKVEFWFQKPTPALKVDFRSKLVIAVNERPITVETALERTAAKQLARQQRSLFGSPALNNTLVLKISDQKKIDFRFVAHASQQTLGFEVANQNRRGAQQFAHLFVQSEPSSGQERRFQAIASTNEKRYQIAGAWLSDQLHYEITDERSGEKSDVRVALKGKCVTVEARKERAHKKYDVCINYDNENDESLQLALEETNGGQSRQMSANVEVDTRGRQSVKIDVTWTPQLLNEWTHVVSTWFGGDNYLAEMMADIGEEGLEKWSALWQTIADDILYPAGQLLSDQSGDLVQEFQKIFGNFDRLLDWDALYRQWQRLQSHVSRALNSVSTWDNTWYRPLARGARKQCQKLELCYKLLYGIEKYGFGAIYDYLQWNAMRLLRESHRLVVVTSGRLLVSLPAPQWLQDYKEEIYGVWQSIIASNPTLQAIVDTIDRLVREVNKEWEEIDAKKVQTIGAKLLRIAFDVSAQRVVLWDPARGRLSLEVSGSQLRRQLRSTKTQYRKLSEFWL